RPGGVVVVVGLAIMYLFGPRGEGQVATPSRGLRPRYALRRSALWLALAPAGIVAFSVYMAARYGDALAWVHAQQRTQNRHFTFPLETAWNGMVAAAKSVHHLTASSAHQVSGYDFSPAHDAVNILQFAVLAFAVIAIGGVLRRLPLAYGAYCVASLVFILSSETPRDPLVALHRYVAVLFPMFIWLALVC